MSELVIVLCTFPTEESAAEAAHTLVHERLCACVNILPRLRSIYRWRGEIEDAAEVLCLIKTTTERHAELVARLRALHSYEVPEIVTLAPSAVGRSYLEWVAEETT